MKRLLTIVFVLVMVVTMPANAQVHHIVGGTPDDNPAVVIVTTPGEMCSGSVIAPNVVLTAAHCVIPGATYSIQNQTAYSVTLEASVTQIYVEPNYDSTTTAYDAAIMVFDTPSVGTSPKPITLSNILPAIGQSVTAVGYGHTADGGDMGLQNSVPMTVQSPDSSNWTPTDTQFEAGAPNSTIAPGDSGGPLLVGNTQVGISDLFYNYTGNMPSVFTSTASIYDWVQSVIKSTPIVSAVTVKVTHPKKHHHPVTVRPDPAPGANGPAKVIPGHYVCTIHISWPNGKVKVTQTCRYVFNKKHK